ncbi:MAG: hypothetical protein E3J73_04800 [Candidatus Bathyarchaeum sp.]|nr:MAG: hypothetical protein E3J73_04800 [Candidatus Bathyarchaeum sp.]
MKNSNLVSGYPLGSRSTRSKLKIVFIVNLLIIAVAIPSYLYVDSLIPKPAQFQVTDLILDQDWVQFGEAVQISVNVTNVGNKAGNYSVTVTIDDVPIATKTVQLSGAESVIVDFTVTGIAEGNHTVQIGELTESLKVTSEAPTKQAELQLTNLGINRKEAEVGETITVSATATNIGDEAGDFTLELFVNNEKRETKNVQLDGGETTTVAFDITEDSEGDYVVKLGTLTVSFSVTSEAQPIKPADFQVTELTVNPPSVLADEIVEISVKVTNVGEASGSYAVNLKIDDTTRETRDVTLSGGATEIVEFEVTETNPGTHTVEIDSQSRSFTVESLAPASEFIKLHSLFTKPYEVSDGDTVTITAKADNLANEQGTLQARVLLDGEVTATEMFLLDAGATDVPIVFSITAKYTATTGNADGYTVKLVNLGNQSNTLSGFFQVVPTGFHTLTVSVNAIGMEFSLDGVTHTAPYLELLEEGTYTITIPDGFEGGGTFWNFTNWIDGSVNLTRTIQLDSRMSLTANYMQSKSCPSLYVWNGEEYLYTAEISDGTGYLGIFDYFREDGSLAFLYSDPWDYTKLNASRLEPKDGYYDMILSQKWDEISYVDSATLVIVDHSPDVDVFSTKATYLYNPDGQGEIYTISKHPNPPVSCINATGHDVLPLILERDGITTTGNEFHWDTLELNLGDLSDAEEIKLLVAGTIIYSTGEEQGEWAGQFWNQPGEKPFPPPYMEVKDAEGNWVPVPDNRQFPLLDVTPDCFVVNLTGVFLTDDYSLRIHTFFNTRFDYIGVDTTTQQEVTILEVTPSSANLTQAFTTNSTSTGNFTRYGDVTELLQDADNEYVIMRQGDQISILFSADLPPVPENMERDYFLFASVWFKVDGLPYVQYTVDPLPFHNMTCFPYDVETESYPDAEHLLYLSEYNTRIIVADTP